MTTATGTPTGLLTAAARGPWIWIPIVVILFCAPLFLGLDRTDFEGDEAFYSFAVDRILVTGDWLTPRISPNGIEPYLEKPPLKLWIVALPIHLGLLPHNEIGMRFWDAVFGSLAFLYVFLMGRRLGGPLCGLVAVLVLFAHRALLMNHGLRTNTMDAALMLSYCGGVYHFLRWQSEKDARRQRVHAVVAGLYFVLGFMTKFVAVVFLPVVLAASLLSRRDGRMQLRQGWRMWVVPALMAIALIAPWYLYQLQHLGLQVWKDTVNMTVTQRFTATLMPEHLHPWHYYLTELIDNLRTSRTLVLALAGFVVVAFQTVRRNWYDGAVLLWWLILPLTLLSFGTSKLYHYTYPFLPPLALAAGYAVSALAGFLWSDRSPLGTVDRAYRNWVQRLQRATVIQNVALAIAVTAFVATLVTVLHGAFSISAWGLLLFRNSNPVRSGVIGVIALMLSGRFRIPVRAGFVTLIVAATLPLTPYQVNLSVLHETRRPIHDMRDCLQRVSGGTTAEGPGLWIERAPDETFFYAHTFFYYMRSTGLWQERDTPSDLTVYMNLYAPAHYRPVLLSKSRYVAFTRDVRAGEQDLIDRVARKADMSPSDLAVSAQASPIGMLNIDNGVLLLPGPYAVCGPRQVTGPLK